MKQETRTKNSIRNVIFSMIAYMIKIILGFVARRFFIYYFNEEYLGLSSLFTNVLSILSLAELGFGTAIVFSMYKPMAEGDSEKVRQLLWYYKKCYTIIGIFILVSGLCILPFMDVFQSKAPDVDVNLYLVYIIYLINTVISYFFSHRRSLLYTSQRKDIESKINIIMNIVLNICQMIAICIFKNYYLYIVLIGINNIVCNLCVYVITSKKYSIYVKKPESFLDKESIKEIAKDIKSLIFHKIGAVVVYSTDSLIIYLMLGSADLGKYSNYLLITSSVSMLISLFVESLRGSVGNSIAIEDAEKNERLMSKLNFIYFWIVSFSVISIFTLSDSFINIVLTKNHNVSLLIDKYVLIFLCISFYLNQTRQLTIMFKECAGIFRQDRFKSLIESVVNLFFSIILVKRFGISGVIIGTIISTLTTCLWIEPLVLYKCYYKCKMSKYWSKYLFYTAITIVVGVLTYYICGLIPDIDIMTLVAKFAVCGVLTNVLLLICYCPTKEFKGFIVLVKNFINKRMSNRKNIKIKDTSIQSNVNIDIYSIKDKNNISGDGENIDIKNDKTEHKNKN